MTIPLSEPTAKPTGYRPRSEANQKLSEKTFPWMPVVARLASDRIDGGCKRAAKLVSCGSMAAYDPHYLRPPGEEPRYELGEARTLLHEQESLYSLYAIDVTASNGLQGRHVLVVPTCVGAASFSVGVLLTERDSAKADAGDFHDIGQLAIDVQRAYRKFRTFPAAGLERFYV